MFEVRKAPPCGAQPRRIGAIEVDTSGLAVAPALIREMSPMRLPLEKWVTFMPKRSPTYLRITALPAAVPTDSETSLLELGLSERFFEQGL